MRRLALLVLLIPFFTVGLQASEKAPVRFGLTAVVVRENLRFFDEMSSYLSSKIDRPVSFVQRKTYREIMNLLESGNLDFAWICGYPYVQKREPEYLSLIAVPIYNGRPYYRSFIIVHKNSQHRKIDDLKRRVFAYSDPDSNSGFLYPQFFLSRIGEKPDSYFRQTFFTYNHAETVEAVAARVADGGAVDSYIWEFLKKTAPDIADQTRVIHSSPYFGFPPIVAHNSNSRELNRKMTLALTGMKNTKEGRALLNTLNLDGLGQYDPSIFDDIKSMAEKNNGAQQVPSVAEKKGTAKK